MLSKFTVGNFKVFKEKNTLDMRAATVSELSETNLLLTEREKLLKSVAVYGKNASGKSNLLNALSFMSSFVISSAKDTQSNEKISIDPFLLNSETKQADSHFEISVCISEKIYRYGFEVNKDRVTKEWLLERVKTKEYPLFLRVHDSFEINGRKFSEGKNKEEWTRKNALFLSLCAQLNGQISQTIIDWFADLVFVSDNLRAGFYDEGKFSENFLTENEENRLEILGLLKKADVGIEDVRVEKGDSSGFLDTLRENSVELLHTVYDENNKPADSVNFDLYQKESRGTAKFFNLAGYLIDAVRNGKIIVIDEIGTMMHTLLSKAIVLYFNSEQNRKAQLIFTTHDTNLLDNELLRRDQIYFTEKDKYGAGRLYSLADFKTADQQKIRKDADYEANYLRGRYGAIPFIQQF